ncbi:MULTISPECIES: ScbR family autoregulator-binding transcription factor [Streptomyces]|uniref:Putative gamma-butyrolactone binding protein n=1 Tax=Streptomyces scabiei (strain 87.22) TaxID=680198 RepID=C9Z6I6_STRSW|nr:MULTISPECIES: ScbR family autoregulator-binding transcription factor [Streptomyces]KFG06195.1 gamma-butyrolactone-binding protein [Streptomyces scabiei]MDW8477270.1 ScbR family autoregulator-binding transcription factor [Streptomyces scabiei]MDX2571809.1 ScbR family autoregulator-binding transcription factor [Streptomyces scabiei]MDX2579052.1 ScbR family autoregulator-binding transcription factor [Streptomyces scabiei]MDX2631764.1 ScbR family autoregulator-binding transcription factor [Stre
MAQQARAVETRRLILQGAALVFDEMGYDAASIKEILSRVSVTKGALYFHFPSKEDLARGVLEEQTLHLHVSPQTSKLQEVIDLTMAVAHALPNDAMLRAGSRLALERGSIDFAAHSPFLAWAKVCEDLLEQAKRDGEVLPHVDCHETAELIVGSFTGIQAFSQISSALLDLEKRVSAMWKHILPSVAIPAALARLDTAPDRGARLQEAALARQ